MLALTHLVADLLRALVEAIAVAPSIRCQGDVLALADALRAAAEGWAEARSRVAPSSDLGTLPGPARGHLCWMSIGGSPGRARKSGRRIARRSAPKFALRARN